MKTYWAFGMNVISFIFTGVIIVGLNVPIKFRTPTSEYPYPDQEKRDADTLPNVMLVDQFANHFHPDPTPYINVTDDDLCRFWLLPPKTRMSDRMAAVARCRLALDRKVKSGEKLDPIICNRIRAPWTVVTLVIAIINVIIFVIGTTTVEGLKWVKSDRVKRRCAYWMAFFGAFSWAFAAAVYLPCLFNAHDIGLSYVMYGYLFPRNYYVEMPRDWSVVFVMCSVNFMTKFAEVIVRHVTILKKEKEAESHEMESGAMVFKVSALVGGGGSSNETEESVVNEKEECKTLESLRLRYLTKSSSPESSSASSEKSNKIKEKPE